MFVLSSFGAVSNVADSAIAARRDDGAVQSVMTVADRPVNVKVSPEEIAFRSLGKVAQTAKTAPLPLERDRFNERFGESRSGFDIVENTSPANPDPAREDPIVVAYSPEAEIGQRELSVRSSMDVFSYGAMQDQMADGGNHADALAPKGAIASSTEARPDLLSGVPGEYAKLVTTIAAEEGVDPNLMLSIMRVENAGFDPQALSPAGAIGLMQVMPKVGDAFGAIDLTDPAQNIRAGARFLRELVHKYKNPVLIASAYNAGEPRVDARRSLPLIRETADYVTRVVGLYMNMNSTGEVFMFGRSVGAAPAARKEDGRSGQAERAKSSMLVFSIGNTSEASGRVEQESRQAPVGGPVKIKKEEEALQ
ncbi:transglycosylase SLT domain-containing protein [Mesorhizobium sp.]|uniref:lytic transglycosylase domain-containing protein n=1 Tax=Mesorhizobium sp. TaxID=1871066 RepID=UPI0025E2624C|nr:transglycosylase SLT domain-containing protein [Mesorhizobium sp.]